MHRLSALLAAALLGTGCAGTRGEKGSVAKPSPRPPAPPQLAPVIVLVSVFSGKVVLVHGPLKYIIVEGVIGRLPPAELWLNVYRDGQKVGAAVVSRQSRGAHFAADLTQGEARLGDTVRSD